MGNEIEIIHGYVNNTFSVKMKKKLVREICGKTSKKIENVSEKIQQKIRFQGQHFRVCIFDRCCGRTRIEKKEILCLQQDQEQAI